MSASMRISTFGIFAVLPILGLAKDCAVYYDYVGDVVKVGSSMGFAETDPDLNEKRRATASKICTHDIGGHINSPGGWAPEAGITNGHNPVNRCTICRGARGGTRDYDKAADGITYSIRCGYFGPYLCSAK
uniref:Effector protein n=1 Tax=Fusarium oxysporum f. sp. apii TaxID=224912 RepID=A0A866WMH0_FUSOX|nr:effector protein [Fusarium oxysporum f. sp. apii]